MSEIKNYYYYYIIAVVQVISPRPKSNCLGTRQKIKHHLQCEDPQGSVLGARMYTMYTSQLSDVIKKYDVMHHSYADDTQIYIHSEDNPEARREATDKLQRCIYS